jgi:hypothetical protein
VAEPPAVRLALVLVVLEGGHADLEGVGLGHQPFDLVDGGIITDMAYKWNK